MRDEALLFVSDDSVNFCLGEKIGNTQQIGCTHLPTSQQLHHGVYTVVLLIYTRGQYLL